MTRSDPRKPTTDWLRMKVQPELPAGGKPALAAMIGNALLPAFVRSHALKVAEHLPAP